MSSYAWELMIHFCYLLLCNVHSYHPLLEFSSCSGNQGKQCLKSSDASPFAHNSLICLLTCGVHIASESTDCHVKGIHALDWQVCCSRFGLCQWPMLMKMQECCWKAALSGLCCDWKQMWKPVPVFVTQAFEAGKWWADVLQHNPWAPIQRCMHTACGKVD